MKKCGVRRICGENHAPVHISRGRWASCGEFVIYESSVVINTDLPITFLQSCRVLDNGKIHSTFAKEIPAPDQICLGVPKTRLDREKAPAMNEPGLQNVASVLWFKSPADALKDVKLFLAHVMTYGTLSDISTVLQSFSEADFEAVLNDPPLGVFDRRSWIYWIVVLMRARCGRRCSNSAALHGRFCRIHGLRFLTADTDPYDLALSKLERNIQRDRDETSNISRELFLLTLECRKSAITKNYVGN